MKHLHLASRDKSKGQRHQQQEVSRGQLQQQRQQQSSGQPQQQQSEQQQHKQTVLEPHSNANLRLCVLRNTYSKGISIKEIYSFLM